MAKDSQVTDSNHPDWKAYRPEGNGRTDEQIRADVHELLLSGDAQHAQVKLDVVDGVVTLEGDVDAAGPLLHRIREMPSVKDVRTRAS